MPQLSKLFITRYQDLLNAITSDNYESLESLCEPNLTLELAAKMYEFEKHLGIQFRAINAPSSSNNQKKKSDDINEIKVLNHFYISGMDIDRSQNPSLKDYKMVQRRSNWIEYVRKGSLRDKQLSTSIINSEGFDNLEAQRLTDLLELKKIYQIRKTKDGDYSIASQQQPIINQDKE